MSALAEKFKDTYYAGETAQIAVAADAATSVEVVYGNAKIALALADDGLWKGSIPTSALIGRVVWTVFAVIDGCTVALAHGAFTVLCAGRSPLRDVIDAIDEAVRTWGTNPNRSIAVGEINITYKSLDELMAVRAQYVQRAEEQENGRSLTGGLRVVEVCF
nr:MAG TPA: hypothetical protein [Caudoviricetes sp.]